MTDNGATVHTLVITGDEQANEIDIRDNGAAGVTAECDGDSLADAALVDHVSINALGGPDTINYSLSIDPNNSTGDAVQRQILINSGDGDDNVAVNYAASGFFDVAAEVDLGAGDDRFEATIAPDDPAVTSPQGVRTLHFNVAGGAGSDAIHATIGGSTPFDPDTLLPAVQSEVVMNLDGGADADTFSASVMNVALNEHVAIDMAAGGGEGAEEFQTTFEHVAILAPIEVSETGGNGGDSFSDVLTDVHVRSSFMHSQSGGNGSDSLDVAFTDVIVAEGGAVTVMQLGENGEDQIGGDVEQLTVQEAGVVKWNADGGNAKDELKASFFDVSLDDSDWTIEINLNGNNGSDQLAAVLQKVRQTATDPAGSLLVHLNGLNGSDNLSLIVGDAELNAASLDLLVDGGRGPSTCSATSNVVRVNCEKSQGAASASPRKAKGFLDDLTRAAVSVEVGSSNEATVPPLSISVRAVPLDATADESANRVPTFAGDTAAVEPPIVIAPRSGDTDDSLPGLIVAPEDTSEQASPAAVFDLSTSNQTTAPPSIAGLLAHNSSSATIAAGLVASISDGLLPTAFTHEVVSAGQAPPASDDGAVEVVEAAVPVEMSHHVSASITLDELFDVPEESTSLAWEVASIAAASLIVLGAGYALGTWYVRRTNRRAALVDQVFAGERGDELWPKDS